MYLSLQDDIHWPIEFIVCEHRFYRQSPSIRSYYMLENKRVSTVGTGCYTHKELGVISTSESDAESS